jgi:hypothetical protein
MAAMFGFQSSESPIVATFSDRKGILRYRRPYFFLLLAVVVVVVVVVLSDRY